MDRRFARSLTRALLCTTPVLFSETAMTKLKDLKREIEIDGNPYVLTLSPEGLSRRRKVSAKASSSLGKILSVVRRHLQSH